MGTLDAIKSAIDAAHDHLATRNIKAHLAITVSIDDWMRLCRDLQQAGMDIDMTAREMMLSDATVRAIDGHASRSWREVLGVPADLVLTGRMNMINALYRQRAKTASDDALADLKAARDEAIKAAR